MAPSEGEAITRAPTGGGEVVDVVVVLVVVVVAAVVVVRLVDGVVGGREVVARRVVEVAVDGVADVVGGRDVEVALLVVEVALLVVGVWVRVVGVDGRGLVWSPGPGTSEVGPRGSRPTLGSMVGPVLAAVVGTPLTLLLVSSSVLVSGFDTVPSRPSSEVSSAAASRRSAAGRATSLSFASPDLAPVARERRLASFEVKFDPEPPSESEARLASDSLADAPTTGSSMATISARVRARTMAPATMEKQMMPVMTPTRAGR